MEYKFAVAIISGAEEIIMGIFDTKEDADAYGKSHVVPAERGLQYCFSSLFTRNGKPSGDMRIYNYYNSRVYA